MKGEAQLAIASEQTWQEQLADAEQMSEWLTDYLLMDDSSAAGVEVPDIIPTLTRARLTLLTGERSVEEQLRHARDAYGVLDDEVQYNAFLFIAGYSQRAITMFGDERSDESVRALIKMTAHLRRSAQKEALESLAQADVAAGRARKTGKEAVAATQKHPVSMSRSRPQSEEDVDDSEARQHLKWQDDALCAQTDPEMFFPEKGGSTRNAKKVCNDCEVTDHCLNYALEQNERFGIWGGLSERERRKLARPVPVSISSTRPGSEEDENAA